MQIGIHDQESNTQKTPYRVYIILIQSLPCSLELFYTKFRIYLQNIKETLLNIKPSYPHLLKVILSSPDVAPTNIECFCSTRHESSPEHAVFGTLQVHRKTKKVISARFANTPLLDMCTSLGRAYSGECPGSTLNLLAWGVI